jgi:carbonic anhydrase/acetyltransferase-like protein (isoleucine patch superfamily)
MPLYQLGDKRPAIGRDVFIAEGARVIGDVTLGDGAGIWFNAVLRGDYMPIRIGARTNIQDNSVVHITAGMTGATVGDDVTVGHAAIIHGCTVGNLCLIGMGSTVLDGAVVGDESFVAAGSLITPGTVIPPRSFVLGRPAKVVRPVTDREILWIKGSAESYASYAREFMAGCTPL